MCAFLGRSVVAIALLAAAVLVTDSPELAKIFSRDELLDMLQGV